MDLTFTCPNCRQELEAETTQAGTETECPTCGKRLIIPEASPQNIKAHSMGTSAAAREEHHFAVPVRDKPSEILIEKPLPPLEAATDSDKKLRIRCIKRTDCVEVGKDHFEEVVTKFLEKVGEPNIVSINTLNYTHIDMGTRQILTDYGVMIVYKG